MDPSQDCTIDLEFWPIDDLAMKFNYIRVPDTDSNEADVLTRMDRQVKESKQRLELLREDLLEREASECTFNPGQLGSPKRGIKEFLAGQSHFLKEKQLHLQKLKRVELDRKKEVFPYRPTINEASTRLAQKALAKPLVQRLAKQPLKIRHIIKNIPKAPKQLSAAKSSHILESQLKKEVKAAWEAEAATSFVNCEQLGRLLVELGFLKGPDSLLNQIWCKLNVEGRVSRVALVAFLLQESRLSGNKPSFDALYYNRSLSASRSKTRADTESSTTTSCEMRMYSHA